MLPLTFLLTPRMGKSQRWFNLSLEGTNHVSKPKVQPTAQCGCWGKANLSGFEDLKPN